MPRPLRYPLLHDSRSKPQPITWPMAVNRMAQFGMKDDIEHNYGHGDQYLSLVLALLMMLTFMLDQTQQLCDPLFRAAWQKLGSKQLLWERLRGLFNDYHLHSLREMYEALYYRLVRLRPVIDSS